MPSSPLQAASLEIPQQLIDAIVFLKGEAEGMEWLGSLGTRVEEYSKQWGLVPESIALGGAMSACFFAHSDKHGSCVLKIPADATSGQLEAAAVQQCAKTSGAPAVYAHDAESGVMLMERIIPGESYTGLNALTDCELRRFTSLFARLSGHSSGALDVAVPSLDAVMEERFAWARVRENMGIVSDYHQILAQSHAVFRHLSQSRSDDTLIHGDLQAKNILIGEGAELIAIDPLACSGDPLCDIAMYAVLQDTEVPIRDVLRRVSEMMNKDLRRLMDWAFVISAAELRPSAPERLRRQMEYIDAYRSSLRADCSPAE